MKKDEGINIREMLNPLTRLLGLSYPTELLDGIVENISDGYHTFKSLYFQRMVLTATIVNTYKKFCWKSKKHEDGSDIFDGDWFIVCIETPQGPYSYHYQMEYWNTFECEELEQAKPWDGHTEKDVTRLLTLPLLVKEEEMKLEQTVDMMLSDDYKERFKAEYHQVTNRITRLQKMLRAYKDDKLDFKPKCSYDLLLWQLKAMQQYQYVLKLRAEIEKIKLR